MENKNCCCNQKKIRSAGEKKKLFNRLSRIEGQLKGIRGMLENDAYCPDILIQISAATAALDALNRELLASHIRTCVADGVRGGDDGKIDELIDTLRKMMK